MSFDDLSNEQLAPILNHPDIPLQKRIQFRAVSSRWQIVIENGLKEVTTLYIRDERYDHLYTEKPNDLVVSNSKYFTDDLFNLLGRLFSSTEEITVFCWSTWYFQQLPKLLTKYSSTLKSLTIPGRFNFPRDRRPTAIITQLARGINSLTNLSYFHLMVRGLSELLVPHLGPTFGRIKQLTVYDSETVPNRKSLGPTIFASLTDRCTHLRLFEEDFDMSSTNVDSSLTHLQLHKGTEPGLAHLCNKLSALTSLSVDFYYTTFGIAMLRNLFQLDHLTDLKLNDLHYSDSIFHLPHNTVMPLYSVKRLGLRLNRLWYIFEGNHFVSFLAAWFPSLEHLTIKCQREQIAAIRENFCEFPSSAVVTTVVEVY